MAAGNTQMPTGVFTLKVKINPVTGITCVCLPFFNREAPLQGCKTARNSILKLMTGRFDDVNPLHLRTEYMQDNVTPDPYFKVAPGWSTLSGARFPQITCKPLEICEVVTEVVRCVPFVRDVELSVVTPDAGVTEVVTLDRLREMDIDIKRVPNLWKRTVPSPPSSSSSSPPSVASPPAVDLGPLQERQDALDERLRQIQEALEQVVQGQASKRPRRS